MSQTLQRQPEQRRPLSFEIYCGSISPIIAGEVVALISRVWPEWSDDISVMAQGLVNAMREDPTLQVLVAWQQEHIVGQAQLFQRVVRTSEGQIPILALSGLCSDPRLRNQGIGKNLVQRAFEEVNLSHYPICLFQTDAPGFFFAFGAREVTNRFINRRNRRSPESNPWWQPSVMIYPDSQKWPEGEIDLNGPPF